MKKINSLIKKLALACLVLFAGTTVFAQGQIDLAPNSKGVKISESSFKGFHSTFSFNKIEGVAMETEKGEFSAIKMDKTVMGGELGAPSLPIARELVAVPFGATPVVKVVSYTTQDYNLSDYGINKIYPQQQSYSKSTKVEDMVFQYKEKAYQTRSLSDAPEVSLNVMGTMRGVQLGALQVEPVSYNPANNTLRVYNDIQVEVVFENADIELTEKTLVNTYSPYFDVIYKQLFNSRAIEDVYDDHPDIFSAPVRMLVIANRMFEEVMQPWLEWKTQKGFYLTVKYTDEIDATANGITSYVTEQYNTDTPPTFVVIFGDKDQVVPSKNSGYDTGYVTDLYYSSVDGDYYPDIYHSRMCCETVAEMEGLIHKILQYEQYTMPDPSYLDNVLLIAGVDSYWNPIVGQPTIEYASHYYFNEEHGYENVYKYLNSYSGCYNNLNTGVGFANYTAHGSETSWADPSFTVSNAYALTNTDKYFWAMGNCCNAANWGYGSVSLAEAMIRGEEKGAWSYIGSCPVTYWWEDYYFGVGATNVTSRMPLYEETTMGNYDAQFMEDSYNTIAAVPFSGNLAVAYSHTEGGYESAATTRYYFEAYHVLGDASVMPYRSMPSNNDVSHLPTFPIGMEFYTVNADPGSYVGISKDGVLHGAGMIGESGTADIEVTPVTSGGDVTIVVTHPNRVPYVETVTAAAMDGAYLSVSEYTPNQIAINQETILSLVVKNVGADATTAGGTITLSCEEDFVAISDAEASFDAIAVDGVVNLENEFALTIVDAVENGTKFNVFYTITSGSDSWEGRFSMEVVAPEISFKEFAWAGAFVPGETYNVVAKFENVGDYKATNAKVVASSESQYVTIANDTFEYGTIDPNGVGYFSFDVTVDASCPQSEMMEINFDFTADNGVVAEGMGMLRNTCNVVFEMQDEYGDGWNGSYLEVSFNDGTPSQNVTLDSGSSGTAVITMGSGTHVTVSFSSGSSWDYECSFTVKYEDGDVIYESVGTPFSGVLFEFDVNCAGGGSATELNPVQNLNAEVNMNQVTLTWDAPRAFVNYLVERNGLQIAEIEETTFVESEVENGTHTYSVIAVYEEGQSLPVTVVVIIGEALEENNVMFAIYPNPAQDVININTNAAEYEYQLINALGQVVVNGQSSGKHQINVSNINKGVYFLKVVANGETSINKVLVQ